MLTENDSMDSGPENTKYRREGEQEGRLERRPGGQTCA